MTHQKGLARKLVAYVYYIFAQHFKVVVSDRQFANSWLTIYKYNHVYYLEIFDNQKGGCIKIGTKNENTFLDGEKKMVPRQVVVYSKP